MSWQQSGVGRKDQSLATNSSCLVADGWQKQPICAAHRCNIKGGETEGWIIMVFSLHYSHYHFAIQPMVWHVKKAPKKKRQWSEPSPVPLFQWASSFRYQSPASCWPQRGSIFSIGSFAKKIGKRIFHSSASRRSGQKYLSFSLGKLPYTQKHPSVFGCKSLCLVVKPPLLVCGFDPSEKY